MTGELRHAVKTGLAAALTALAYPALPFADPQHYAWPVMSAVLVMQSNLGGVVKAASNRGVGTLVGAATGAACAYALGAQALWVGVAVTLTIAVCGLFKLPDAYRLAGSTAVLVVLSNLNTPPWHAGLTRFADVAFGMSVALLVQAVVWPARAGEELRGHLAESLLWARSLLEDVVLATLRGVRPAEYAPEPRGELLRRAEKAGALLDDLGREPGRHRKEFELLKPLVTAHREFTLHLIGTYDAVEEMGQDSFYRKIEPQLGDLTAAVDHTLAWLAGRIAPRAGADAPAEPADVTAALKQASGVYADLRKTGVGLTFEADEILRFGAFFFNLKSLARCVREMAEQAARPEGAAPPA